MGDKVTFYVEGKPRGKERARTFYDQRAGKMRSITPEQTKSYEDLIRWSYKAAGGEYMGEKLIKVDIIAFYPMPQSWSKKKKAAAISHEIRPKAKPDVDNCAKVVLDALNSVCYLDDSQVVDLSVKKFYTIESPFISVKIEEAKNE